jgi:16S rRNA U516 pseudouridylate synthase RsuA-like enzyme
LSVSRLTRIRYGSVELPRDLRAGAFKNLTTAQISELARLAGAA